MHAMNMTRAGVVNRCNALIIMASGVVEVTGPWAPECAHFRDRGIRKKGGSHNPNRTEPAVARRIRL